MRGYAAHLHGRDEAPSHRLCDGGERNNHRPVYSWVMNNLWETNFKMDLSGFCEYCYSLWLTGEQDPEQAMDELRNAALIPTFWLWDRMKRNENQAETR